MSKILVFAYGNLSRGDDALGPLLLDKLQAAGYPGVECLLDFQLQIEHALDLQNRDLVLFIDAHLNCPPPFTFTQLKPAQDRSYTTHAMSPQAVLQVFSEIHRYAPPPAFLLSIRGESFELGDPLSLSASRHLISALEFSFDLCQQPEIDYWLGRCGSI